MGQVLEIPRILNVLTERPPNLKFANQALYGNEKWFYLTGKIFCLPATAKMSVLVKCRYKESFTTFLRSFSSFIVWVKLMNMYGKSRKSFWRDKLVHKLRRIQTLWSTPLSITHLTLQKMRLFSVEDSCYDKGTREQNLSFSCYLVIYTYNSCHTKMVSKPVFWTMAFSLRKELVVLLINEMENLNQKLVKIYLMHMGAFTFSFALFPQWQNKWLGETTW